MATVAVSAAAIDLKTPASYPIRLGASIVMPAESSVHYTNVRYNHKPLVKRGKGVHASIKRPGGSNGSVLTLKDGEEKYSFAGENASTADTYVLVSRGSGKAKEVVLERLRGSHTFNLVGTPKEGLEQLRKQYPHIGGDEEEDGGLSGDDEVEEEAAEPDNPFDYRHFLKAAAEEKTRRPESAAPRSTAGTPLVQARAATATPTARPAKRETGGALLPQKKRKAPAAPADKPSVKRVKTAQEAREPVKTKPQPSKAQPKPEAPPPKIRVDRKASLRRPSYDDDDSGELVLEGETPVSEKFPTRQKAMSLALSGQLGQGPISLRSAASSPASRVASPVPPRPDGMDEDGEFEIGGSNSPEEIIAKPSRRHAEEVEGDADEDGDADEEDEDADVEDLELPSPAAEHRPSVSAATVTGGGDEDDLDAQLAAAMAEEEDVGVQEEEESEEE